ncbi:hypothetical protein [Novosphingobium sp. M1R2S20]|uniref:Uncharacterized protein n=1 Tax=Novosphingobium rhizovicinum TaxID=3228928 RepID=A0ABV3RE51_9SPHN
MFETGLISEAISCRLDKPKDTYPLEQIADILYRSVTSSALAQE